RHLHAVLCRERRKRDTRMKAVLTERLLVARAVRQEVEDAVRRNTIGGGKGALLALTVGPMQILMHQEQVTPLRSPYEKAAHRVENLSPPPLRIHRRHRFAGVDREQVVEVWQNRAQIFSEQNHTTLELARDTAFWVGFLNSKGPLEHVDDGVKRH